MINAARAGALLFAMAMAAGCSDSRAISSSISDRFNASGRKSIDLADAVPGPWSRVCVLGPYSTNTVARQALGFDWDAESRTNIERDDGIALLLFVEGDDVVAYTEHPRSDGDFTNLSGQCFTRNAAWFVQINRPETGWPGLFPAMTSTTRNLSARSARP